MDPIKDAFQRAKQDIQSLKEQIAFLQQQITELKSLIKEDHQSDRPTDQQTDSQEVQQTPRQIVQQTPQNQQTIQQIIPTDNLNELDKQALEALKPLNSSISTGNGGVPADRQTDQQTDRHTANSNSTKGIGSANQIQRVSELLSSLDEIKREVRLKFKKLTQQEMLVFATLYQLENQEFPVDYPLLASKLKLTESSIRDYIQKIIKKGIPVEKTKENNKKIYLKISKNLKQIASLSTIIQLREI